MRTPVLLLVAGLILLAVGAVMQFTGGAPRADTALVDKCRAEMQRRGAGEDMAARCSETAFATAMTATDADAAARAISAANGSEIGSNTLSMFLIGLGLVLTVGGAMQLRRQRVRA